MTTRRGQQYFIAFTDDAKCFTTTYVLVAKSDAFAAYKQFEAWARMQNYCSTFHRFCVLTVGESI